MLEAMCLLTCLLEELHLFAGFYSQIAKVIAGPLDSSSLGGRQACEQTLLL